MLDGLPGSDLGRVTAVVGHTLVEFGNLGRGNRHFGRVGRQIIPEFGNKNEFLRRGHPAQVRKGFQDHVGKIESTHS